jgi:hypothetical protein
MLTVMFLAKPVTIVFKIICAAKDTTTGMTKGSSIRNDNMTFSFKTSS